MVLLSTQIGTLPVCQALFGPVRGCWVEVHDGMTPRKVKVKSKILGRGRRVIAEELSQKPQSLPFLDAFHELLGFSTWRLHSTRIYGKQLC